jgi:hypothetical protein
VIRVAKSRGRVGEWIGTAIVLAAALQYWLWYFRRSLNLLDEGSTAAQALRIVNGELIYRDFFTVVTPGSYYTVAWLLEIFGERLMVLRWAALVTGVLMALVTLVIARRLMAWPFAAGAALMTTVWGWFLVTPNYYSLQAALFALTALACYLRWAGGAPARWILLAGVMTGLTAMVKQNVGAYTAVALLIAICGARLFDRQLNARRQLRASAMLVAGICVPVLPTLLYLMVAGAGPYLYESWVYYPLAKYPQRFSLPFPQFFPVLPEHGVLSLADALAAVITRSVPEPAVFDIWIKFVVFLPVLVFPIAVVAVAVHAYRAQQPESAREGHALLAIVLIGAFLLLQSWPRADVAHILFGLQPTFILLAYVLSLAWRGMTRLPGPRVLVRTAAMAIALVPLVLLLWNGYRRTDWEYANYVAPLRAGRAAGVTSVPIDTNRVDAVIRYIAEHTTPEDPIFVVPWAAGFYFLTDRSNPTRTDFMLFEDPELYPCLLSRLEQQPPKYVIYGYTWDVDDRHFREYAAPVDRYIRSRYTIESSVDGYEIWRRIEGAGHTIETWPNACQPRRFRWRDLLRLRADTASAAASSVQ